MTAVANDLSVATDPATSPDDGVRAEGAASPRETREVRELRVVRPWRAPPFDIGWLLLIPGIVLIAMALLLPAQEERDKSRFFRDRALASEQHSQTRLAYHHDFLGRLKGGDEATLRALVPVQLNQAPAGTELLIPDGDLAGTRASLIDRLEPRPLVLNQYSREYSWLQELAMDQRKRLYLLLAGAGLVFAGLLPATRPRGQ